MTSSKVFDLGLFPHPHVGGSYTGNLWGSNTYMEKVPYKFWVFHRDTCLSTSVVSLVSRSLIREVWLEPCMECFKEGRPPWDKWGNIWNKKLWLPGNRDSSKHKTFTGLVWLPWVLLRGSLWLLPEPQEEREEENWGKRKEYAVASRKEKQDILPRLVFYNISPARLLLVIFP